MADYLIKGETLEAMGNKVREVLGVEKYSFKEEAGTDGVFNADAVTVYYNEYVDYDNQDYGLSPDVYEGDVFIAYDFIEDNNGVITPVIYKTDINGDEPDTPDLTDEHFYVGQAEIDGVVYDKWRKIEADSDEFSWDSQSKKYLYTNVIVNINTYSPTEIPSKMDDIYNAGYEAGSGEEGAIDDLTGTTWRLNDNPYIPSAFSYSINFISSGKIYTNFKNIQTNILTSSLCYDDTSVYNSLGRIWLDKAYQTLTFTGGTDATNTDLINWLYANGELISNGGYYENTSITSVGNYAFSHCDFLTAVNFPQATSIGGNAFSYCKSLVNVNFSDSLTTISNSAFAYCDSLVSANIPDSVTSINGYAFDSCVSLVNARLSNTLTSISGGVFYGCSSLTSIEIPSSVTSIGYSAFNGCTALTDIKFNGTKSQWNAITKQTNWKYGVPATTVTCSDGTVTL